MLLNLLFHSETQKEETRGRPDSDNERRRVQRQRSLIGGQIVGKFAQERIHAKGGCEIRTAVAFGRVVQLFPHRFDHL